MANGHTAAGDLFHDGNGIEFKELPITPEQRALIAKISELEASMLNTLAIARDVMAMGTRVVLCVQGMPEKEKKPHAIKDLLTRFDEAHQARFSGERATINGGQDATLIKRLIAQHGEDRVRDLIAEFFELDDEWLTKTGYTVGNFSKRIPGLISSSRTPVRAMGLTPRTAANKGNAREATAMIKTAYGAR